MKTKQVSQIRGKLLWTTNQSTILPQKQSKQQEKTQMGIWGMGVYKDLKSHVRFRLLKSSTHSCKWNDKVWPPPPLPTNQKNNPISSC